MLTTLVAIVDTGVDLDDAADVSYYNFSLGYDAYRGRLASTYGTSVVQDNGHTPDGATGHWHGSTIADDVIRAIGDTKAQAGAKQADVKIVPIRATNDSGTYDTGAVIRGIRYAADAGAAVIDLSFKASGDFASNITGERLSSAIAYAASKGAVVSVAAANDHVNVDDASNPANVYPLALRAPNMLVSAAVDSGGTLSLVSNWGAKRVDLGSPGVGGYTSYAAGYTAGVVGVIAELTPGMSATDRVNLIKQTVTQKAQAVGAWATTGGVINPAGAVARAVGRGTPVTGSPGTGSMGTGTGTGGATNSPVKPVIVAPATSVAIAAGSSGGTAGYQGDGAYTSSGEMYHVTRPIDLSGVSDPAPAAVYQTERWSYGSLTYTVPNLTPGASYTVRLDFAENWHNAANLRLFDVAVNGMPTLSHFDIYTAAGGMFRAVSRSSTATADAAGKVTITLTNVLGGAKVDAIRVTSAATATPAPATTTPVSLTSVANAVGISADGNTIPGNIDGWGYSYSATALGSTVTTGGVSFTLWTANTANAVRTNGQTVRLTAGKFSGLRFLGTGVNGTQAGTFTVRYTDGTTATASQTFSDWHVPINAPNEAVAATTPYRNATSGRDNVPNFNLYSYNINLNSTKTVQSVTLPTNWNIALLAAALIP